MFDLALDEPVARLSLNRPEAHNAIPQAGWAELERVLDKLAVIRPRVLLLHSHDPGQFCAGADLGDLAELAGNAEARRDMRATMRAALDRLASLPFPVIAAIDGACFGAGVALALACDVRVAGHGARFSIPPARLGIGYPHEDVARLVGLIGWGQASRMLFTATPYDSTQALAMGLVEMADGSAWAAANELATTIAGNASGSMAMLKRSIALAAAGTSTSTEMDEAFEASFASDEFAERMAVLHARRSPGGGR
ncbi:enoyl-CoA hydratase/isomerase family protein [Sphingomonas cavernae]|uniref:Enoyl-CoA hydratase/isomerase family protein n=2 Tax=Sphingomonas cavernae TaxID=2320861 RepID=A0A418W6G9_9SPHN|nr:enoyl-CoA hydratase/isomerase family protein [Sphingomonas cavernae]